MTFEDHGHLLEGCVARPLSDAVDGDLHLSGSIEYSAHGVGCGHTEVVMAVGGKDGVLNPIDMVAEVFDFLSVLRREAVSGCVGNVDHGGTRLDDRLHHSGEVFVVRSSGIFGIELHVVHKSACIFHCCHCPLDDFLAVGVELILDMRVRGADSGVDTFSLGEFERLYRHVDIFLHGSGECAYSWPRDCFRDFDHGIEVARA